MRNNTLSSWVERYGWPLLILLLAAVLRFHDLALLPPGLTHDEADHGLTAWQITASGLREIYFTVGYGREPLYDYIVAAVMSFLGPTILAGRLVSAFASLILISAMMAWVKQAFSRSTALMTGAGLAVGFWPVMSGRQALRSILLPTLFVLAVLMFWLGFKNVILGRMGVKKQTLFWQGFHKLLPFIIAGIVLGLTFYTYIPARVLWSIFPVLLLYWFIKEREFAHLLWWRIAVMLLVTLIVAAPLLLFFWTNPGAEMRIRQLAAPLYAAQEGDWGMISEQAQASLRLFFVEGDPAWRYNISGRPFLTPLFGILFILGVLQALWWVLTGKESAQKFLGSASFLALSWLVAGFAPVLIAGPALSMTQAIAIQPLIYLFPAVALASAGSWLAGLFPGAAPRNLYTAGIILLFAALAVVTWRDYFQNWVNHPEVRVQYETTMATAMDYLNTNGQGEVAISTITPGRYHSPALAEMTLNNEDVTLRWFDGRGSLLLPREESAAMVIPGFSPLPPALLAYLDSAELSETLPMREGDLDRPLRFYDLNRAEMLDDWRNRLTPIKARFGDTVELAGFELRSENANPGEEVSLVTYWQAQQPLEEAVFFTHLLGAAGEPLAQTDRLDVPGYSWAPGDNFLQVHQFTLPADMAPGDYQLAVGVYSLPSGRRLTLAGELGGADLFLVTSLTVEP